MTFHVLNTSFIASVFEFYHLSKMPSNFRAIDRFFYLFAGCCIPPVQLWYLKSCNQIYFRNSEFDLQSNIYGSDDVDVDDDDGHIHNGFWFFSSQ